MGKLIYAVTSSIDGFIADEAGNFDWTSPCEAMNQFANIWNAGRKIVYSKSLMEVSTANTTIEREFNARAVHNLIAESDKDFGIGGPRLAANAIRAGIVDEFHQFIVPEIIGGGNHWLPKKVETKLELVELQKYENGIVYLQYKQARIL